MTPALRSRIFRELLQIQLCRVSFLDALGAVAEELDLDLLREIHRDIEAGGSPAEGLSRLAPEALNALRKAEADGTTLDALRDLAQLPEGEVPPPGTLARDLYEIYGELARLLEDAPVVEATRKAAELPVREALKSALLRISAENSFIRAMRERPELFSPTARLMVKISEEGGNIRRAFLILADGVKAGAFLST